MNVTKPVAPPVTVTEISTAGDLRAFLSSALVELRAGTLDAAKANAIQRLASQINESMYAELKAMALMKSLAKNVDDFGDLLIADMRKEK